MSHNTFFFWARIMDLLANPAIYLLFMWHYIICLLEACIYRGVLF